MKIQTILAASLAILSLNIGPLVVNRMGNMAFAGQLHHPNLNDDPFRYFDLLDDIGHGYIEFRNNKASPLFPENKKGILAPDGTIFMEFPYDSAKAFGKYFIVKKGYRYNLLKKDGTFLFSNWYYELHPFGNGHFRLQHMMDKWAIGDSQGNIIGNQWFANIRPLKDGVAIVEMTEPGEFNILNLDGSLALSVPQKNITISDFNHGYAVVKKDQQAFFVDKTFKRPTNTSIYNDAIPFSDAGIAAVKQGGKWHYINLKFQAISKYSFKDGQPFSGGLACISDDKGRKNFLTTSGKMLLQEGVEYAESMQEGFAVIGKNNRYNFINKQGEIISEQWFDEVEPFEGGFAKVKNNNKFNFINTNGKLVDDARWYIDFIQPRKHRLHRRFTSIAKISAWKSTYLDDKKKAYLADSAVVWFRKRLLVAEYHNNGNATYQFFDLKGKPIFDFPIESISTGSYGFIKIERPDGKLNLLDSYSATGELIGEQWFDFVSNFANGTECILVQKDKKENLLFADGSFLSETWSDDIKMTFSKQSFYAFKLEDDYVMLDRNCRVISEKRYKQVESNYYTKDYMCFKENYRWHKFYADGHTEPSGFLLQNCLKTD